MSTFLDHYHGVNIASFQSIIQPRLEDTNHLCRHLVAYHPRLALGLNSVAVENRVAALHGGDDGVKEVLVESCSVTSSARATDEAVVLGTVS